MRQTAIFGVILIVLGIAALTYQGLTYTTREEVFKAGPIKAVQEKEKTIPISPVIGALALAGGVAVLIYGKR